MNGYVKQASGYARGVILAPPRSKLVLHGSTFIRSLRVLSASVCTKSSKASHCEMRDYASFTILSSIEYFARESTP